MIAGPVSGSAMLSALILCGLLGLLGQGIRAAVGLKNASALTSPTPNQQSQFSTAYFTLSLMIGFVSGVLAGFVAGIENFIHDINPENTKVFLGIIAAGYAGADFIENAMSIVLPGGATPPSQPGGGTTVAVPPTPITPPQLPLNPALTQAQGAPLSLDARLSAALRTVAPGLSTTTWLPALTRAFTEYQLDNNRRIAAALGQFLAEAGSTFTEIAENLHYTTPERIVQVWPHLFPDVAAAQPYVRNQQALANRVYANRLGNGDEASGDGYRFRGRGLIQLTGRDTYTEFGAAHAMTADQASAYCETPEGSALSGCWYLATKGCLPLADTWSISAITRIVNGPAMLNNTLRIHNSTVALKALGG